LTLDVSAGSAALPETVTLDEGGLAWQHAPDERQALTFTTGSSAADPAAGTHRLTFVADLPYVHYCGESGDFGEVVFRDQLRLDARLRGGEATQPLTAASQFSCVYGEDFPAGR
jgi:hypothetical protein